MLNLPLDTTIEHEVVIDGDVTLTKLCLVEGGLPSIAATYSARKSKTGPRLHHEAFFAFTDEELKIRLDWLDTFQKNKKE